MELELPQSGSCYVVFRPESDLPLPETAAGTTVERELDDWTLRFPAGWGAPGRMELTELLPWRALRMPDEGRAFSGTAVYETTFDLREPLKSCTLDLGRVEMIAAVTVNGRQVQTLWAPPYRTEIAEYLREGENRLRIEVTGTWFNRLVLRRRTRSRGAEDVGDPVAVADEPLRDSGLLGPVRLVMTDK